MTEGPSAPTQGDEGTTEDRSLRDIAKNRNLSVTALLAIAGLIALAVWLVVESVSDDGGAAAPPTAQTTEPVAVNANGLATLAEASGQPIYWVGPREGWMYELRQEGGQVFVRYLPPGVPAGDAEGRLSIATYPVENAYAVTTAAAGANPISLPGGAVGLLDEGRPNNGYVAFRDVDYQIEVYDPDANVVRELVTSGAVQPVPAPKAPAQARGPEAVTQEDLVALADELGHPVYWAGPRENTTYELTVNEAGAVYIRYLPPGVDVGEQRTALTVGTYPVEGAFALTKGSAAAEGTVDVPLPGPGIALHSEQTSNNVHVAYPNIDVQIEVYSPVAAVPPRLVTQGKIVPVS